VHGSRVDVFHKVFVSRFRAFRSHTTPVLGPEFGQWRTFDVPHVGNGDDHFIIGIEVFRIKVFRSVDDFGATFIAVFFLDFQQFVFDDVHAQFAAFQHLLIPGNLFHEGFILVAQFLHFQSGQLAETHFNDSPGLYIGKIESRHEAFAGFVGRLRRTDNGDNLIDVVAGYD